MKTPSPKSPPPSTPQAVFASLLTQLGEAGRKPAHVPASPATPEALAAALFDVAAGTGAALFSVWAAEDDDAAEEDAGEADGAGEGDDREDADEAGATAARTLRINAGITFFFIGEDSPDRVGLLGSERVPVRQPIDDALYRPLGQALVSYAKRGADPRLPDRGSVSIPVGSADPDLMFRVSFREDALGTWTTALARSRETRQAFPSITSLPLAEDAGMFLEAYFREVNKALFSGQVVLLTGAPGTGRSTTLRALMDALPDNVHALAAVEEPKGGAGGAIGMVRVGPELTVARAVRSFLRQDPDLLFADEVRTLEDLQMLCNGALTGHGTACVLEAKTPEDGYAWMTEAMPGIPIVSLIVHHTRDAATGAFSMTLHEAKPTEDGGALRIVPWTPPG
ncbi:Flp pilus assembly complex ATPase component [Corallococcus sp. ZKHCc1 1396]|uniref:Flp pilus assembly complex ATPase component n=1 Tax=Corallococcus soli TaxID=2710757 RepID=A0ABR9PS12_9BACT|nr:ATPase, T2SS/T4P/T4SS family [Corallococcus soli]MBE4750720.1 Flp pilus assembly complex ATPase component [Corallococcus soli]